MAFSMPLPEFSRLKLVAKLTSSGNLDLSFQSMGEPSSTSISKDPTAPSDISLHVESSLENGAPAILVYVSSSKSEALKDNIATSKNRVEEDLNNGSSGNIIDQFDPIWPQIPSNTAFFPGVPLQTGPKHAQLAPSDHLLEGEIEMVQNHYYVGSLGAFDDSTDVPGNSPLLGPQDASSCASSYPISSVLNWGSNSNLDDLASRPLLSPGEPSPSPTSSRTNSPSSFDAEDHRSSSSNPKPRDVPCLRRGCKRKFASEHRRDVHLLTHQAQTKNTFECTFDGCPEVFSRKHDRMRHEVTQHGKACNWVCDRCRKFFSAQRTLAKHKCTGGLGDTRWVVPTALSPATSSTSSSTHLSI